MLKGIDPIFTPELLCELARMGHSDELAIVDQNYPAYSSGAPVVHVHGHTSTEFLAKLLALVTIDDFGSEPIAFMIDPRSPNAPNDVQRDFIAIAEKEEGRTVGAAAVDRKAFYERARSARVVVVTSEVRPFGCFLVSKGVWPRIDLDDR